MIYFIHKGPGDHGADPKSFALAGKCDGRRRLVAQLRVDGHWSLLYQCQGIMFYASRLHDTRCKILFASQSFPSPNLDGFVLLPVRRRDLVLSWSNVAPVVTFPGTVFL
jgi:hypothetical protein